MKLKAQKPPTMMIIQINQMMMMSLKTLKTKDMLTTQTLAKTHSETNLLPTVILSRRRVSLESRFVTSNV